MSTLKERIAKVIQPGESVTLPEVISRVSLLALKLKADERRALESLTREEVNVAKNRKHYIRIEALGLSESYLCDKHGVKVHKWRITPAGRAWLADNQAKATP